MKQDTALAIYYCFVTLVIGFWIGLLAAPKTIKYKNATVSIDCYQAIAKCFNDYGVTEGIPLKNITINWK